MIVVINGDWKEKEKIYNIAVSNDTEVILLEKASKRMAVSLGIRRATNEIVVLLDSDTYIEKGSLSEITKPFQNCKVGGVTSKQVIRDGNRSLVPRIANWIESMRFLLTKKLRAALEL